MIYLSHYDSPLRQITIAQRGETVIALWFDGQTDITQMFPQEETIFKETPLLKKTKKWLDAYFAGKNPVMDLPLHTEGTPFQQRVWQILRTIPYGHTMTYQEVGQRVIAATGQKRMSAQAVGQAVGHNPISILIPCHRVLGKDGSLTGYAGGVTLKKSLLELEHTI